MSSCIIHLCDNEKDFKINSRYVRDYSYNLFQQEKKIFLFNTLKEADIFINRIDSNALIQENHSSEEYVEYTCRYSKFCPFHLMIEAFENNRSGKQHFKGFRLTELILHDHDHLNWYTNASIMSDVEKQNAILAYYENKAKSIKQDKQLDKDEKQVMEKEIKGRILQIKKDIKQLGKMNQTDYLDQLKDKAYDYGNFEAYKRALQVLEIKTKIGRAMWFNVVESRNKSFRLQCGIDSNLEIEVIIPQQNGNSYPCKIKLFDCIGGRRRRCVLRRIMDMIDNKIPPVERIIISVDDLVKEEKIENEERKYRRMMNKDSLFDIDDDDDDLIFEESEKDDSIEEIDSSKEKEDSDSDEDGIEVLSNSVDPSTVVVKIEPKDNPALDQYNHLYIASDEEREDKEMKNNDCLFSDYSDDSYENEDRKSKAFNYYFNYSKYIQFSDKRNHETNEEELSNEEDDNSYDSDEYEYEEKSDSDKEEHEETNNSQNTNGTMNIEEVRNESPNSANSSNSNNPIPLDNNQYRLESVDSIKESYFKEQKLIDYYKNETDKALLFDEVNSIPTYVSLLHTIYDLYLLKYPRIKKWFSCFYTKQIEEIYSIYPTIDLLRSDIKSKSRAYNILHRTNFRRVITDNNSYDADISRKEIYDALMVLYDRLNILCPGSVILRHKQEHEMSKYTCVIKDAVDSFVMNTTHILYIDPVFCEDGNHLLCFSFLDSNHKVQTIGCQYYKTVNVDDFMYLFNELWYAGLKNIHTMTIITDDDPDINTFVHNIIHYHDGVKARGMYIYHVNCAAHILSHVYPLVCYQRLSYWEEMTRLFESRPVNEIFTTVRIIFYNALRDPAKSDKMIEEIGNFSSSAYKYFSNRDNDYANQDYIAPHYCVDTTYVREKLKNEMFSKDLINDNKYKTGAFDAIYRFIVYSLNQLLLRRQLVENSTKKDEENESNYEKYDNEGYCKYVIKEMVNTGYLYEIIKDRYKMEGYKDGVWNVYDKTLRVTFSVDFASKKCSCGLFQQFLYPCIHAVCILHCQGKYCDVLDFVDNRYKNYSIRDSIHPIHPDFKEILQEGVDLTIDNADENELLVSQLTASDSVKYMERRDAILKAKEERRKKKEEVQQNTIKKARPRKQVDTVTPIPYDKQVNVIVEDKEKTETKQTPVRKQPKRNCRSVYHIIDD